MRLVEICVDGGLEATMHSAQAQLADAYLAVGAGIEARVIAEDLVAREPWDRLNIERFRRALAMLGETDIDGTIADRLSGQIRSPAPISCGPTRPTWRRHPSQVLTLHPRRRRPHATDQPTHPPVAARGAGKDAHAIDVNSIRSTGGVSAPGAPVNANTESDEVDLSDVLYDLREEEAAGGSAQAQPAGQSIERVLKGMRDEAAHDSSPETAGQHFKLAGTYMDLGMLEEAKKALEVAARSPRHRFRAGAMLGKAYLAAGDQPTAIEWYGRAVEAPAPSPLALHALLYGHRVAARGERRECAGPRGIPRAASRGR